MALQGNGHYIDVAIALAAALVVFRHAILRAVLGALAVAALAALVAGALVLAQAVHL